MGCLKIVNVHYVLEDLHDIVSTALNTESFSKKNPSTGDTKHVDKTFKVEYGLHAILYPFSLMYS